ncbi:hypothetical protein C2S52_006163 [Perilla frutescens var. hirtella]|nr:hypothetical protein C2S52_006163 [Perilla frutescens var. hirtella]
MGDPVIISYGKGLLPAFCGNPQAPLDFIPADLVANTMIAAIAKHGSKSVAQSQPQPNVYHVASSVLNPLTFSDLFEYLYQHFNVAPLVEGSNIAKLKFFDNFEEFSNFTRDEIFRRSKTIGEDRKMIRECNAKVEYALQLCKTYKFAGFFKARFHTGNTLKLIEEMSKEELLNFEVDARNIDWKTSLFQLPSNGDFIFGFKFHIMIVSNHK